MCIFFLRTECVSGIRVQTCLWMSRTNPVLPSPCGEIGPEWGRRQRQNPDPSSQSGPHKPLTSSGPSCGPAPVYLRFPSQGSELHARHHQGLQCPLLGLPQFPCEAAEVCLTPYTYGLPHFHPRQRGPGFLLQGLWPPSFNGLPGRSPEKPVATPGPQLPFPTLPISYTCCENLFSQSTLRAGGADRSLPALATRNWVQT